MAKATWNGEVIAESNHVEIIEGNYYFPRESVRKEFLRPSETKTFCPWKGTASYYHIEVSGETNRDAAWFYPDPKDAASMVADRVAFWRGVEVEG